MKNGADDEHGMSVEDEVSSPSTILVNTAGFVALGVWVSFVTFYACVLFDVTFYSVLFSCGLDTFCVAFSVLLGVCVAFSFSGFFVETGVFVTFSYVVLF